jgi:carbon storage regulator CsrA
MDMQCVSGHLGTRLVFTETSAIVESDNWPYHDRSQHSKKEFAMSLVLTRRTRESIVIFTSTDEQIAFTIESINGDQVKISFDAPDTVGIWREELLEEE